MLGGGSSIANRTYFRTHENLERLMHAFLRLDAMHLNAALRQATSDPFPTSYTERIRTSGVVDTKNKLITDIIAEKLSYFLDTDCTLRQIFVLEAHS